MDSVNNVAARVDAAAFRWGTRTALIVPCDARARHHVHVTFAELRDQSCAVASALAASGIGRGDRVAVMVPMSVELYAILLGVFRIGAIASFVDPWMPARQLEHAFRSLQPRAFLGSPLAHLMRLRSPTLRAVPLSVVTGALRIPGAVRLDMFLARACGVPAIAPVAHDDTALITFTSGSSGRPKASNRAHGHLLAQHEVLKANLGPAPGTVDMPALPIFALNTLACGATAVIPAMNFRRIASVKPDVIRRQMIEHQVTQCTASPIFFERLLNHCARRHLPVSPLKRIHTGGAPVRLALARALHDAFGGGVAHVVYGSTEAEPISLIAIEELTGIEEQTARGAGLCVGRPVPQVTVRLLPVHDGDLDASAFDDTRCAGEVAVSGPHVNDRYAGDARATARYKIREADGRVWHRTGDVARLDAKGRLWLTGSVGSSIDALAVEAAALARPAVKHAALMHGRLFIQPASRAISTGAIAATLRDAGLRFRDIVLVSRMPLDRRHGGKIDRAALAAMAGR